MISRDSCIKGPPEEDNLQEIMNKVFNELKRRAREEVLYDVLTQFYFADWTRACDYEKMTSEEVVEAAMAVCKKLEEKYNYSLDNDIFN